MSKADQSRKTHVSVLFPLAASEPRERGSSGLLRHAAGNFPLVGGKIKEAEAAQCQAVQTDAMRPLASRAGVCEGDWRTPGDFWMKKRQVLILSKAEGLHDSLVLTLLFSQRPSVLLSQSGRRHLT